MTVTTGELRDLISRGEDAHLEFKAGLPRPSELAREVSSLANAGGGWLIIGVDESDDRAIGYRSVDVDAVDLALQRALMLLRPAPRVGLEFPRLDENTIAFIAVEPVLATPVLAQGIAFTRAGARTVPANAYQLMGMVGPQRSDDQLLLQLRQFSEAIEAQSKIISEMQTKGGWKNKLLWAVIGAVVGVLFSLPTLLFQ